MPMSVFWAISVNHPVLITFSLFHTQTPPPPRDESVASRDQPISPRYTSCIYVSRIGSALPHRVNSRQTRSRLRCLLTLPRFPRRESDHEEKTRRIWNRTLDIPTLRPLLIMDRNIGLEMCCFGALTSFYARTESWAGFDALE